MVCLGQGKRLKCWSTWFEICTSNKPNVAFPVTKLRNSEMNTEAVLYAWMSYERFLICCPVVHIHLSFVSPSGAFPHSYAQPLLRPASPCSEERVIFINYECWPYVWLTFPDKMNSQTGCYDSLCFCFFWLLNLMNERGSSAPSSVAHYLWFQCRCKNILKAVTTTWSWFINPYGKIISFPFFILSLLLLLFTYYSFFFLRNKNIPSIVSLISDERRDSVMHERYMLWCGVISP